MGQYVLTGSRYAYRDEDDVLVIKRRGDKVDLTKEQEQRLNAGNPGSAFQSESIFEDEEPEIEEVAVANEATLPAEDGFQASALGTANRRRPAPRRPEARDAQEAGERDADSPTPAPVTDTSDTGSKTTPKPAARSTK